MPICRLISWWIVTLATLVGLVALAQYASESYKTISPEKFNEKIAHRTDIETPEALITYYHRGDDTVNTYIMSIETEVLEHNSYKITLIEKIIDDDELAGIKVVLFANRTGQSWIVSEIRKNWKCFSDYGHPYWGT